MPIAGNYEREIMRFKSISCQHQFNFFFEKRLSCSHQVNFLGGEKRRKNRNVKKQRKITKNSGKQGSCSNQVNFLGGEKRRKTEKSINSDK